MIGPLAVLEQPEIESIHARSLELLGDVGIHLPDGESLAALAEGGAVADDRLQIARMPARLIEDSIRQCGKQYSLFGREPGRSVCFGAGQFIVVSSPGQFAWLEDDGRTRRDPALSDVRWAALVGDALAEIDVVGGLGMALDIPASWRDVAMAAELIKGTPKVTQVWISGGASLRFIIEMYEAVRGGAEAHRRQPMLHGFIEPVSPLRFAPSSLDILKTCARKGLPLCIAPMVQAGASGPATLAGTLVVENAEILAGIVLTQIFGPGVPVCYGGIPHLFDMPSMQISFGAPEQALMAVAMTQLARFYGLPVYVNAGLSDSKLADAQSGMERGITLAMGALAGADTFGHMGIVGSDQAGSLLQLVLDNEMAAYVKRILRGLDARRESLALPVIEKVGIGGSFLAEPHTRDHFREQSWFPRLCDRRRWEAWESDGAASMRDRARSALSRIIAGHRPEPCDEGLALELERVTAAAALALG